MLGWAGGCGQGWGWDGDKDGDGSATWGRVLHPCSAGAQWGPKGAVTHHTGVAPGPPHALLYLPHALGHQPHPFHIPSAPQHLWVPIPAVGHKPHVGTPKPPPAPDGVKITLIPASLPKALSAGSIIPAKSLPSLPAPAAAPHRCLRGPPYIGGRGFIWGEKGPAIGRAMGGGSGGGGGRRVRCGVQDGALGTPHPFPATP